MATAKKLTQMSEEEYLQFEANAQCRNEYVDGQIHAMAGANNRHNVITGNIFSALHRFLDDTPCRPYMEAMKVRVKVASCYYYPDVMVSCEDSTGDEVFREKPVLVVEVLSPSTAAIDRREKLRNYRKIPELQEYILVHQTQKQLEVYRREADGTWSLSQIGAGESLELRFLPNGGIAIPVEQIYKNAWKDNEPPKVSEAEGAYVLQADEMAALAW